LANFIQSNNVNQTLSNFKPNFALSTPKELKPLNAFHRASSGSHGKEKEKENLSLLQI
jgi:hypothetical protein